MISTLINTSIKTVQLRSNLQPAVIPNLVSATTDTEGLAVLLEFDVNMDNPAAFAADFTVKVGVSSVPIDRVALEIGTKIITVYPVDSFNLNEVVTFSVASGNIKSASGGVLAAITNQAITNNAICTTYYISNTGSDAATGKTKATAWLTVNKVNTSAFSAGDNILFKSGETWRETLTIPSSGSSSHDLNIGSYGTGAKPQILGSTKLTAWTSGSIGGVAANNNIMVESFEGTGYQNTWTETIGANTGNLVEGAKKTFIVFPNDNYSNMIVWENEFLVQSALECTGTASIKTEFEFQTQKLFENLVEKIQTLSTTKEVKLYINTGWILKSDVDTIESILRSKRAWLLQNEVEINLVPVSKSIVNTDLERELIEFSLEFIINRTYNEETYSL